MLVSDRKLRLDVLETYNSNLVGPKSKQMIKTIGMGSVVQTTKAANHNPIEFIRKKKTVNIDLDAAAMDRGEGALVVNMITGGPY